MLRRNSFSILRHLRARNGDGQCSVLPSLYTRLLGSNDGLRIQCCLSDPEERLSLSRALQVREFRSSAFAAGSVEVEIQSMGESITEGSIAEILKREGDSVQEDEVIAQIETDKVTIDIKAPVAGKLSELRVKRDDTVKVGQVVAIVAEGEGGIFKLLPCKQFLLSRPALSLNANEGASGRQRTSIAGGNSEASSSESQDSGKASEQADASSGKRSREKEEGKSSQAEERSEPESRDSQQSSSEQPEGAHQERKPSIKFPARRTSDGRKISDLPPEERTEHLQSDSSQQSEIPPQGPQKAPEAPQKRTEAPQKQMPWYVGKEQGTKLSQSRVLSQRDMEQIELGGAEP